MKIKVLREFKFTSRVTRYGYTLTPSSKVQDWPDEVAEAAIAARCATIIEKNQETKKESYNGTSNNRKV